jgi:hypothetical protein
MHQSFVYLATQPQNGRKTRTSFYSVCHKLKQRVCFGSVGKREGVFPSHNVWYSRGDFTMWLCVFTGQGISRGFHYATLCFTAQGTHRGSDNQKVKVPAIPQEMWTGITNDCSITAELFLGILRKKKNNIKQMVCILQGKGRSW